MNQELLSIDQIQEKIKRLATPRTNDRPVIVAYGLMNAGKSFLLNMLTKHIDEEFFKTNDVRETAEVKKFESDKYIYLDTPGLDANEADDAQAQIGVSQADIVLFIHQPQGELEANEVNFLMTLRKSFGNHAESNIILVLSKIEKEEQEKIDLIEEKIQAQCSQELGFSPTIFKVSNKRYQTGVVNQKNGLITQSRIDSLAEHIDLVGSNTENVRTQRGLAEVDALLRTIESKENDLKNKAKNKQDILTKSFSAFNDQIPQLNKFLEASGSQFCKI